MENLISVAKIVNFHGIKGEVKVGFTKGKDEQIASTKCFYLKVNDSTTKLIVNSVKFHKGYAIIKFDEINSINDAEKYKGFNLYLEESLVKNNLAQDEYLVSDLQGIEVFDTDNKKIGVVCSVGENNANDLLTVIDTNDKKHLIPFVKDLVPYVDLKNRKLIINNIEGLIN
ncbi:MAG: ribosome maturation factor RimM [Candidatus Gastranaerophilales bacterium]|nr:ribosome maturation factor RimM [Candidatus Gastranaerophilales bacterium]